MNKVVTKRVGKGLNVEALKAAFDKRVDTVLTDNGLDFEILKIPLMGMRPVSIVEADGLVDESIVAIETVDQMVTPYFGLFNGKTNECINTCKGGYTISQNREILELVMTGMESFGDDLQVYKAGSLNGGRKVFIQLEIAGLSKIGNGDTLKRYVTIIDSNDGSTGLSVGIGDLTMSCQNQFYKFYKKGQSRFRHTATLEERIKELPMLIEGALKESLNQVVAYNKFETIPVNEKMTNELVKVILGHDILTKKVLTSKSTNHMNKLYDDIQLETATKGKNLWGLHSGITRWLTHSKIPINRANGLEESLMSGTSYVFAQKSFAWSVRKAGGNVRLLAAS